MPSSDNISDFLIKQGLDGFLLLGDSLCNLDLYYLSGFFAPDRFALLASDSLSLFVSGMEKSRAMKESKANVESTSDYKIMEKMEQFEKPEDAYVAVLKEFLQNHNVRRLGISGDFPVKMYQHLAEEFELVITASPVSRWRAVKSPVEIDAITRSQRACESAMKAAIDVIGRSQPKGERLLLDGTLLTSEMVKFAIDVALLEMGCEATDTIVAGGKDAADPHCNGSGPLPSNAPIVIDIFPRSKTSRYFADMTRTVLRGEADPDVVDLYDAVLDAQNAGLKAVKAGTTGKEVHARVCEVFRERGYPEREEKGFIHSTGHGVGLEIHEKPSISEVGGILENGNVATVEPGLYYPELAGVRLEDLVVVTNSGCDNLTKFEKRLIL